MNDNESKVRELFNEIGELVEMYLALGEINATLAVHEIRSRIGDIEELIKEDYS